MRRFQNSAKVRELLEMEGEKALAVNSDSTEMAAPRNKTLVLSTARTPSFKIPAKHGVV